MLTSATAGQLLSSKVTSAALGRPRRAGRPIQLPDLPPVRVAQRRGAVSASRSRGSWWRSRAPGGSRERAAARRSLRSQGGRVAVALPERASEGDPADVVDRREHRRALRERACGVIVGRVVDRLSVAHASFPSVVPASLRWLFALMLATGAAQPPCTCSYTRSRQASKPISRRGTSGQGASLTTAEDEDEHSATENSRMSRSAEAVRS